jgi:N-carbamoyl-L-amino-acid hydrolase
MVAATTSLEPDRPEPGEQRLIFGGVTYKDYVLLGDVLGHRSELDIIPHRDGAGNLWATLPGAASRSIVIGSHLDSVPGGGWLDGCLGVLAGLEVLRRARATGTPRTPMRRTSQQN